VCKRLPHVSKFEMGESPFQLADSKNQRALSNDLSTVISDHIVLPGDLCHSVCKAMPLGMFYLQLITVNHKATAKTEEQSKDKRSQTCSGPGPGEKNTPAHTGSPKSTLGLPQWPECGRLGGALQRSTPNTPKSAWRGHTVRPPPGTPIGKHPRSNLLGTSIHLNFCEVVWITWVWGLSSQEDPRT
jgi:hypothetical protein